MRKISSVLLALGFGFSLGFAADFSKKSDAELFKLNGTLKGEDAVDLNLEIKKRSMKLNEEKRKEFNNKAKEGFEKNTEKMIVKDYRAQLKDIREAMKKRIEKMSNEEKKIYGFDKEPEHKH